jgi:hypothetical protein
LVLKGVSPGAALVFLLAGPATNVTSLTVVVGILGKRATGIYLAALAVCAIVFGLVLDQVYILFGVSPQALAGQAAQVIPVGLVGKTGLPHDPRHSAHKIEHRASTTLLKSVFLA